MSNAFFYRFLVLFAARYEVSGKYGGNRLIVNPYAAKKIFFCPVFFPDKTAGTGRGSRTKSLPRQIVAVKGPLKVKMNDRLSVQ